MAVHPSSAYLLLLNLQPPASSPVISILILSSLFSTFDVNSLPWRYIYIYIYIYITLTHFYQTTQHHIPLKKPDSITCMDWRWWGGIFNFILGYESKGGKRTAYTLLLLLLMKETGLHDFRLRIWKWGVGERGMWRGTGKGKCPLKKRTGYTYC
jgi:hypothetical protein